MQLDGGHSQTLALGLSGGGDSTALLYALRQIAPELKLYALIVDHGLRPESAREAEQAGDMARDLGAHPQILRWSQPRPSQARARQARHRLLAEACHSVGAQILCLGHTYDDRVETLRMRAARDGNWRTMIGPAKVNPAPVWPQGRGIIIARPFLGVSRAQLRRYLTAQNARWIDDPSNENPVYERVRVRQNPISQEAGERLIGFSTAAQTLDQSIRQSAYDALETSIEILDWGGVRFDADVLASLSEPVAQQMVSALVRAVSGSSRMASPSQIETLRQAVLNQNSWSGAGALLTPKGVMGRDPGALKGRADGRSRLEDLQIEPGQSAVFDGRWFINANDATRLHISVQKSAEYEGLSDVPAVFRDGLPVEAWSGLCLASKQFERLGRANLLLTERLNRLLVHRAVPLWFDKISTACCEHVGLA